MHSEDEGKANWHKKCADSHTAMSNKLIAISRRMMSRSNGNADIKNDLNDKTIHAYKEVSKHISGKRNIDETQAEQLQRKWFNDDKTLTKEDVDKHINDIKQAA